MTSNVFTNIMTGRIAARIVAALVVAGACGYALTHLAAHDRQQQTAAGQPVTAGPAPTTANAGIAAENRAYARWTSAAPAPAKGQEYGAFSKP